ESASLVGRSLRDALSPELYEITREQNAAALAGRSVVDERRVTSPGGRSHYLLGRYTPRRDPSGRIIGTSVVIEDLTERRDAVDDLRRSEGRLRQAQSL